MDGGPVGWETLNTSAYSSWWLDFVVLKGTDYVLVGDYANNRIVKQKMNGTDVTYIDYSLWGSDLGNGMTPTYFDSDSDTLFFSDARNIYRTTIAGELIETVSGTPSKVLFKTSGSKPFEIGVSAYSGQFSLSLNSYKLPISYSQAKSLAAGSWHDMHINYDRSTGTVEAYLDSETIPFITQTGLGTGSEIGDYFYLGSDPTDPNRTFSGAIDNIQFGLPDPDNTAADPAANTAPSMSILPETGRAKRPAGLLKKFVLMFRSP